MSQRPAVIDCLKSMRSHECACSSDGNGDLHGQSGIIPPTGTGRRAGARCQWSGGFLVVKTAVMVAWSKEQGVTARHRAVLACVSLFTVERL
ncbi:uncharacterized protein EMH_0004100 [Eimeria mitis]|uniref:Uncharacterized protein n=1 Tax=Eimeria mitis TaxID=44415 RepID=U6K178_9EIME|nr:uncharacterized protein EMH_0004100 [Eimeria mitis]CDJ29523.1 hypothetical protein EMH_0004100 [Eimeria mitis]